MQDEGRRERATRDAARRRANSRDAQWRIVVATGELNGHGVEVVSCGQKIGGKLLDHLKKQLLDRLEFQD